MRRPAALILAALFFFTVKSVYGQTPPNEQPPKAPPTSGKPKDAEKSQSPGNQQNPFEAFQQFSAEMSGGPTRFDKMKIYRSGNEFRAEWDYEHEIRISDLATRRLSYIRHWVNRSVKCGTGDRMDAASYPFFAYVSSDFSVEHSPAEGPAEKETIDGHPTKAENYTVTNKADGTLTAKVKLWEAEDLKGFPVRMEIDPPRTKKFTLDYTNVSLEKPDPKLFQLPKCPAEKSQKSGTPSSAKPKTPKPQ